MRVLIDMNLAPAWVQVLQTAQIVTHAAHWSELGAMDAPDSTIMAYASQHAMLVLTQDLDFSALVTVDTERSKLRLLPFPS